MVLLSIVLFELIKLGSSSQQIISLLTLTRQILFLLLVNLWKAATSFSQIVILITDKLLTLLQLLIHTTVRVILQLGVFTQLLSGNLVRSLASSHQLGPIKLSFKYVGKYLISFFHFFHFFNFF